MYVGGLLYYCYWICSVFDLSRYLQEGKTYDFADFYADCGGLSGLLLGFSAYGGIMAIKEKLLQASKY